PAAGRSAALLYDVLLVVGASLFVALSARVTLPLPMTPVPLTLQNFAVLLVGLILGSRRGAAALALYVAEGAMGFPVFNPTGPGGLAQIFGPTGGYLMAYPLAAWTAGAIAGRRCVKFARNLLAAVIADAVLFAGGIAWLFLLTGSLAQALAAGLVFFVFAEVIKVMFAAAIATRVARRFQPGPTGSPSLG
ncbi:MAG: biotin transporter BioY, partial [Acidobacteria bacterium]|nr:biotin transporter BioY [Acidobacteriota bacterium]